MIITFHDHQGRPFQLTANFNETDSPYKLNSHQAELNEKAALLVFNNDKHIEKKLKRWIDENPGAPQLKNQLTVYYARKGLNDQVYDYNRKILEQHPDYLFAKINLALEYINNNKLDEVPGILGNTLNILDLYPERKIFHTTEYAGFYRVVVEYLCLLKEIKLARLIYLNLEELLERYSNKINLLAIEETLPSIQMSILSESYTAPVEDGICRTEPTLPQTTKLPSFHFKQIEWLYKYNFSIEKNKVEELLQLERGPLIEDLGTILMDAVRRYEYFAFSEYDAKTYDSPIHALLLLQELEAHEALPVILEFLRQPEDLLDFWLGDFLTENVWQVIYKTGKNQLPVLEAFLKEPLNYLYARCSVSTAVNQLAMHEPERRSEVLAFYKNMLEYLYQNKENMEISAPAFNTFIISDIIEIKGTELLQEMERFYQENIIDESMEGNWEDALQRLEEVEIGKWNYEKRELQNIYEVLKEYQQVEENSLKYPDWKEDLFDTNFSDKDFVDFEDVNTEGGTLIYAGSQPFVRDEKKIGRNDPCPCGSGLKYKKCHGKHE